MRAALNSISALLFLPAFGLAETSWEIDYAESSISISAKAWGLVPASFAFESFQAEIGLDSEGTLAQARFDFSYLALTSGSSRRDRRIHEWLEAERHPEGSFIMQQFELMDGQSTAVGQLTLHGQTRPARFAFTLEPSDDPKRLEAVARIDYRDWGLPPLRVLVFTIDPILEINLSIRAKDPAP